MEHRKHATLAFGSLDELDRALLEELKADARARIALLGRRVGLSAPAVSERLRRLEETGVVSYHAEIEPRALGYPLAAIIRVSPSSRDLHRIPEIARAIPEVTECYRITGEDCYFIKIHLRDMDDLEALLDRFTPYGRTTTSIIHSAPVPRRGLPLMTRPSEDPS